MTPRIVTPKEAQERLSSATLGTWALVQEGWSATDRNYSVVSVTDQGYVTVAPAGGTEHGLTGPDAMLVEIAPDLAHTVATEPDRTRAAVVKALRDAAHMLRVGYTADDLDGAADAIEQKPDFTLANYLPRSTEAGAELPRAPMPDPACPECGLQPDATDDWEHKADCPRVGDDDSSAVGPPWKPIPNASENEAAS